MIIAKTENLLFQPKDLWWEFGSSGPANIKLLKILSKFYKYLRYSGPANIKLLKGVLWKYQQCDFVANTFLSSLLKAYYSPAGQSCIVYSTTASDRNSIKFNTLGFPQSRYPTTTITFPLLGLTWSDHHNIFDFYQHHRRIANDHHLINMVITTTSMQELSW